MLQTDRPRLRADSRNCHAGFTLIELLVVISIIALLIALLLPALSQARAAANSSLDATNQKGQLNAAFTYNADNRGFFPVARTVNYGDFTVAYNAGSPEKRPFYGPAGADLWALYEGTYAQSLTGLAYVGNPPSAATGKNGYHTWGALIGLNYAPIELFFTPSARVNSSPTPSDWQRRAYFGDTYAIPWNSDGVNWSPYYGGCNYTFQGSYIYRMADWQKSSFDPVTRLVNGSTTGFSNVVLSNLRPDSPGFNKKTQIMNKSPSMMSPLLGSNVGFGDASVTFFNNANYIANKYNSEPGPYINQVGTTSYGGWRTLPLNAAETFLAR